MIAIARAFISDNIITCGGHHENTLSPDSVDIVKDESDHEGCNKMPKLSIVFSLFVYFIVKTWLAWNLSDWYNLLKKELMSGQEGQTELTAVNHGSRW